MVLDIQGEWYLVASTSMNSEIEFIDEEEPDPNGVINWLNGFDHALVDSAKSTSGLVLTIQSDGTFTEVVSGKPEVHWFDEEGVLQAEVTPFNGAVAPSGGASYLRPVSIAKWAIPVEERYSPAILRYDDGDTKISDRVHFNSGKLIRTVNTVTDELYLDRVVIVYGRRADTQKEVVPEQPPTAPFPDNEVEISRLAAEMAGELWEFAARIQPGWQRAYYLFQWEDFGGSYGSGGSSVGSDLEAKLISVLKHADLIDAMNTKGRGRCCTDHQKVEAWS